MSSLPLERFVEQNFGAKERPQQVKHLYTLLLPGESPLCGVAGVFGENSDYALLTVTDRRVIIIAKGRLYGTKIEEAELPKVTSVEEQSGLLYGTVTVQASGKRLRVKNIYRDDATHFTQVLRNAIHQVQDAKNPSHDAVENQPPDLTEKLEKLAKLKAQGLLTEEEFIQAKVKLLQ